MRKFVSFFLIMLLFITNIQKTLAYSNYETNYYVTLTEFGFMNQIAYGDKTYKDFFDDIKATQTNYYYLVSAGVSYTNINLRPEFLNIYIFENYPLVELVTYVTKTGSSADFNYIKMNNTSISKSLYITDFSDLGSTYNNIVSCLLDYSSCSWGSSSEFYSNGRVEYNTTLSNNSDYIFSFPNSSVPSRNFSGIPVLSNFNLTIGSPTSSQLNSNSNYFKNLYINGNLYSEGMSLPTYYDLYYSTQPDEPVEPDEPDDPVEPDDDSIFTHIYWFFDNSDNYGVLANIYILLFLYCITNLLIKFYSIIRYKNRR